MLITQLLLSDITCLTDHIVSLRLLADLLPKEPVELPGGIEARPGCTADVWTTAERGAVSQ